MKQRTSPGFYNTEMESKYFRLYFRSRKLIKKPNIEGYEQKLVRFELDYYKVSKQNRILNDISKNPDEIIKYLEPTWWKKRVDENAQKLGIKPYEELDKREESFIIP